MSKDRNKIFFQVVLVFVFLFFSMTWPGSSESYQFVAQWGSNGTGDSQVNSLYGIAADGSGNIGLNLFRGIW